MENPAGEKLLEKIDRRLLPSHIAIIMDGNGRWARSRGLTRTEGHRKGAGIAKDIVEASGELGIEVLTLYTFSTENWRRPKREIISLMSLLRNYLREETPRLEKKNVRIRVIGRFREMPLHVRKQILKSVESTSKNTGLVLNLAINYGGRAEILEGVKQIAEEVKNGKIRPRNITEKTISARMYTSGLPDPDLLIRTGGEKRISNFLLWQLSYSELYFEPEPWPEFTRSKLYTAIIDYQNRQRRFGAAA